MTLRYRMKKRSLKLKLKLGLILARITFPIFILLVPESAQTVQTELKQDLSFKIDNNFLGIY